MRAVLLFIKPLDCRLLIFTEWPMIYSFYLSLTSYDNFSPTVFIGLDNYRAMASDPKVVLALKNTFWFAAVQVTFQVVIALGLALFLKQARRATGFFRTAFYLPKMTPQVAIGVLFLLLFNGQTGAVNKLLGLLGITGPAWTVDPLWMKPGLVLI